MQTNSNNDGLTVKITPNDKGNPPGKLADAELHFGANSPLDGLKLTWPRTSPARRRVLKRIRDSLKS